MPKNMRRLDRSDIFLIVEYRPLQSESPDSTGIIRNLSLEGLSLDSQVFNYEKGEFLEFTLKQSHNNLTVTVVGEVVWKKQAWYKYIVGVKLHEMTEETKSKVLEMISVVSNSANVPVLNDESSKNIPERESEEISAAQGVGGKIDGIFLDSATYREDESSEETRTSTTADAGNSADSGKESEKLINDAHEETVYTKNYTGTEHEVEQILNAHGATADEPGGQVALHAMHGGTSPDENKHKSKAWVYVPALTIAVVILLIALPVMIKNINETARSVISGETEPPATKESGRELTMLAGNNIKIYEAPDQLQEQSFRELESIAQEQQEAATENHLSAERDYSVDNSTVPAVIDQPKSVETGPTGQPEERGSKYRNESAVNNDITETREQLVEKEKQLSAALIARRDKLAIYANPIDQERSIGSEGTTTAQKSPEPDPALINEKVGINEVWSEKNEKQMDAIKAGIETNALHESLMMSEELRDPGIEVRKEQNRKAVPVERTDKLPKFALFVSPEKSGDSQSISAVTVKREKSPKFEAPVLNEKSPAKGAIVTKKKQPNNFALIVKAEEPRAAAPKMNKEQSIKADSAGTEKMPKYALIVSPNKSGSMRDNSSVPDAKTEKSTAKPPSIEGKKLPANVALFVRADVSKKNRSDVNKRQGQKTAPVVSKEKLPKFALLVPDKKSPVVPNTTDSNRTELPDAGLFEGWKHVGTTTKGIPLFVDPGNMSYLSEHVVKLSMGAYINGKEFTGLLEINCSQNKILLLEERKGIYSLSASSSEWSNIIPESVILYNSACN
jgi:hypothetical protein